MSRHNRTFYKTLISFVLILAMVSTNFAPLLGYAADETGDISADSSVSDEYDIMRRRLRESLVPYGDIDMSNDVNKAAVQNVEAQAEEYLNTIVDGFAPDAMVMPWGDSVKTTDNYYRVEAIAKAYVTPGTKYYHDADTFSRIIALMEFLLHNVFKGGLSENAASAQALVETYGDKEALESSLSGSSNWWFTDIGNPSTTGRILLLLAEEGFPKELMEAYLKRIHIYSPTSTDRVYSGGVNAESANKIDKVLIILTHGVLAKDENRVLQAAKELFTDQTVVLGNNGFSWDGSFIAHSLYGYTLGYGLTSLGGFGKVMSVLSGIKLGETQVADQYNTLCFNRLKENLGNAFLTAAWRGAANPALGGRGISRKGEVLKYGRSLASALVDLYPALPEELQGQIKSSVASWVNGNPALITSDNIAQNMKIKAFVEDATPSEAIGLYAQNLQSRTMWHQKDFAFGIATNNTNAGIAPHEIGNSENLKGKHTGDGMTYLFLEKDTSQFEGDFFGTFDFKHVPGTTVEQRVENEASYGDYLPSTKNNSSMKLGNDPPLNQNKQKNSKHTLAATAMLTDTDGMQHGSAAFLMDLSGADTSMDMDVKANKSWFMLRDKIVALGSNITSTKNREVDTTIESRKLTDAEKTLTYNGAQVTDFEKRTTSAGDYAHLAYGDGAQIGYYLPVAGQTLSAGIKDHTGNWKDNNNGAPDEVITEPYADIYLHHGVNPTGGTYEYAILPNYTATQTAEFAANPGYTVIKNEATLHAVYDSNLKILAINNFANASASVTSPSGITYEVDREANVLIRENSATNITVSVLDPTTGTNAVTIKVKGHSGAISAGENFTVSKVGEDFLLKVTNPTKDDKKYNSWQGEFEILSNNADATAPEAPQNVTATASDTYSATLAWSPPANAAECSVLSYEVSYTAYGTLKTVTVPKNQTSLRIYPLEKGTQYALNVKSVNGNKSSSPVTAIAATTDYTAPIDFSWAQDGDTIQADGTLGGKAFWSFDNVGTSGNTNKVSNGALEVSSTTKNSQAKAVYHFPAITSGTLEFSARVKSASEMCGIHLIGTVAGVKDKNLASVVRKGKGYSVEIKNGDVDTRETDKNTQVGQIGGKSGEWTTIRMIVDFNQKRMTVFADDTVLAENTPFRYRKGGTLTSESRYTSDYTEITGFRISSRYGNSSTMLIDDIYVTPQALNGNASLTENEGVVTAAYDGKHIGDLTYAWTLDGTPVGTNSPAYTAQVSDAGKTLIVTITSSFETGAQSANLTLNKIGPDIVVDNPIQPVTPPVTPPAEPTDPTPAPEPTVPKPGPDALFPKRREKEDAYRKLDTVIEGGKATVEYDWVIATSTNMNAAVGLIDDGKTANADTTDQSILIRIEKDKFDAHNGSGWGAKTIPTTANTRYHVKLRIDMIANKYDAWITPESGTETQIATNFKFRVAADKIDRIGFIDTLNNGKNDPSETMWIENITIIKEQNTELMVLKNGEPYKGHGVIFTLLQSGEVKSTGMGVDEKVSFGVMSDGTYDLFVKRSSEAEAVDTGRDMVVSNSYGYLEIDLATEVDKLQKSLSDMVADITRRRLKETDYTPETWKYFSTELEAAKAVLANTQSTKEALQAAINALETANNGLVAKKRTKGVYKAAHATLFGGATLRKESLGDTKTGATYSNGSYAKPVGNDVDKGERKTVGGLFTGDTAENYKGKPGAGVTFPFQIDRDGKYGFLLRFSRINYEIEDYISVYVNYDKVEKNEDKSPKKVGDYRITLTGKDSEIVFVNSAEWTMDLKAGDTISLVVYTGSPDNAGNDKGLVNIDYLSVWDIDEPYTFDPCNRTFYLLKDAQTTNDNIFIPKEADFTVSEWSSDKPEVATVSTETGEIAPVAAGRAVITAKGTKGSGEAATFTYNVFVKEKEEDLAIRSELVSLYDMKKNAFRPEAKVINKNAYEAPKNIPIRLGNFGNGGGKEGVDKVGTGFVDTMDYCPVGSSIIADVPSIVDRAGLYDIHLNYAKGATYPTGKIGLIVNEKLAGKFDTQNTNMKIARSNKVTVYLKPGDTIGIQTIVNAADAVGNFNSLTVAESVIIPPNSVTLKDLTIPHQERREIQTVTTPNNATQAFAWTSESETDSVAVYGSNIIGQNVGSATVTATSLYNPNVKASATVTVTENKDIFTLKSDKMTVYLDKTFPRVIQYTMNSGKTMEGNRQKVDTISLTTDASYKLNTSQGLIQETKNSYKPDVVCSDVERDEKGMEYVDYTLAIKELSATIVLRVKADGNVLKYDFTKIDDTVKKIYQIEFPNLNPLTVNSQEPGASFAGSRMQANITINGDTHFEIKDATTGIRNYNYAFVSNGNVAAGIKTNAVGVTDIGRVCAETNVKGTLTTTSLRSASWVWRFPDAQKKFIDLEGRYGEAQKLITKTYEDTPYTNPAYDNGYPQFWVLLAEDNNGDNTVNWQDAANAFRKVAKRAVGSDKISDAVVQRLIMSQGNETNYPYLASLDETKRIAAHTDGLGQIILQKYHNAGNWGDFSVYDDQLGGLDEFKEFVTDATHKYNSFVGVHTNWTEYFAKVKQFGYENVEMQDNGITPRSKGYKAFGYYLHQCYVIDDQQDALAKDIDHPLSRLARMRQFKTDIPDLGFIYSDVYSHNGWRGKELARDYEENGLAYFVEWPYVAEDDAVWAHWAVEKSYSPASLKGYSSDIARFIFNDTKDRWDNYATNNWKKDIEESRTPNSSFLLMGADTTCYEGWVHDGINEYDSIIEKIYKNNIPSKYMQHFPITRMETNRAGWANYIAFEGGVEVFSSERGMEKDPRNGTRTIKKDGKVIYTQDCVIGNDNGPTQYLIPWDDGDMYTENANEKKEVKLYHWNDNGGSTTWELPNSWSGVDKIYVYELSDQGKISEAVVNVADGKVTIEAKAKTPYVVYKSAANLAEAKETYVGKYGLTNPGFSAGTELPGWNITKGHAEAVRNDNTRMSTFDTLGTVTNQFNGRSRNWELAVKATEETEVSQTVSGLTVGDEYAVSVMAEIERGKTRKATLFVDNGKETFSNYTDSSILINYDSYDSKARTAMLRMRVVFKATAETAVIRLHAAAGDGEVRFDNVRVYETTTPQPEQTVTDGKVVLYQDFESAPSGKTGGSGLEVNKPTYEGFFPFNLGVGGGFREARTIMQRKHAPYTQNNTIPQWNENAPIEVREYQQKTKDQNGNTVTGQWWDTTTIPVDLVVSGESSFSNITGSPGLMYQTTPQSLRFEAGKTYRVSFEYQTGINGIFAFVLGAGQEGTTLQKYSSNTVDFAGMKHFDYLQGTMGPYFGDVLSARGNKITAMPATWSATPAFRNSSDLSTAVPNWKGYYEYTFTSENDQTWFGICRNNDDPKPSANPNPFILDNLLVVEVGAVTPDEKPEDKPVIKPDEKPEDKPVIKPDEKPEDKPVIKPDEKPDDKPKDKPVVKPDEKPNDKPDEKPNNKPNDKPVVKPDNKPNSNSSQSSNVVQIITDTMSQVTSVWQKSSEIVSKSQVAAAQALSYVRTKGSGYTGIRKADIAAIKQPKYEHDTVVNNVVQLRVSIPNPARVKSDIVVSGTVTGPMTEQTKAYFSRWFSNKVSVIHLDQTADFGQQVNIAARVNLAGVDTKKLVFLSYDKTKKTYRRIKNPAYRIDKNGYLWFTTSMAGDIVISESALIRK